MRVKVKMGESTNNMMTSASATANVVSLSHVTSAMTAPEKPRKFFNSDFKRWQSKICSI